MVWWYQWQQQAFGSTYPGVAHKAEAVPVDADATVGDAGVVIRELIEDRDLQELFSESHICIYAEVCGGKQGMAHRQEDATPGRCRRWVEGRLIAIDRMLRSDYLHQVP